MVSLAVIVLDACRADTFREHFDWLEGRKFTNAWSTSHWTAPAHASLYTGLYPSEIGTVIRSPTLETDNKTIVEKLNTDNFRTTLITSNLQISAWDGWLRGYNRSFGSHGETNDIVKYYPENVVNWSDFGTNSEYSGVKKYISAIFTALQPEYDTVRSIWQGYKDLSSDGNSINKIYDRLRSLEFDQENEFLFANVMDMHAPYYPPSKYRSIDRRIKATIEDGLTGQIDSNTVKKAYRDSARWLSDKYKEVFELLDKKFDYVITMSDHGELLGEHNLSGEHDLFAHIYGLHPELTKIPIVISGPGIENELIDKTVSLLDVHKTISEIAGVEVESRGQSLLSDLERKDRLVEYHGISRREEFESAGIAEQMDQFDKQLDAIASTEGYAYETISDFVVNGTWSKEDARERLDNLIKSIDRKELPAGDTEVPTDVRQRLQELGYA